MSERDESNLSLAKKIGTSHTSVGRWLSGVPANTEAQIKAANALNVSVQWLLTGEGAMDVPTKPAHDEPGASSAKSGALDMEDQVIDEIRVRVAQFKLSPASMRKIYQSQIVARLDEYGAWCDLNCEALREALLETARKSAEKK